MQRQKTFPKTHTLLSNTQSSILKYKILDNSIVQAVVNHSIYQGSKAHLLHFPSTKVDVEGVNIYEVKQSFQETIK